MVDAPPQPTAHDLEAIAEWGLTADCLAPPEAPPVDVWPENEPVVRLFAAMLTQWRSGPAGPVGLDYNVLGCVARCIGMRRQDLPEHFASLQIMEAEALSVFAARMRRP